MAQATLTDNDCRIMLTTTFNDLRVVDPMDLNAYSYGLRLDTSETLNNRTTTYVGFLKLYDNSNPTAEVLKSELTLYMGTNLIQRTVADGVRVWSYDPTQNAYSVNAYNVESGTNTPNYRPNFITLFKQTAIGSPLNLITLMDQASITGTARVKDWMGGLPFVGQRYYDPKDTSVPKKVWRDIVWQTLPDNSRYVQFTSDTADGGYTYSLSSVRIHRQDKVGSSVRLSDTYLTVGKDTNGLALSYLKSSPDFIFVPPARSKVLATPRTVKF